MKKTIIHRTLFQCAVCGKMTAGRVSRQGGEAGDLSHRFPRRHKRNGADCPGNIEEAKWFSTAHPAAPGKQKSV